MRNGIFNSKTPSNNPVKKFDLLTPKKKYFTVNSISINGNVKISSKLKKMIEKENKIDMMVLKKIGRGTFGEVYKVRVKTDEINKERKKNYKTFALKLVLQSPSYLNRELAILLELGDHENLTRLHFYKQEMKENNHVLLWMFMDYCKSGDLGKYLTERKKSINVYSNKSKIENNQDEEKNDESKPPVKFSNPENLQVTDFETRKIILKQLISALSHLHAKKICHRDIKPSNILFKDSLVKLCDFGNSKPVGKKNELFYVCSRFYRAPELLLKSVCPTLKMDYTESIDIWATGCVYYELITGRILFKGNENKEVLQKVFQKIETKKHTKIKTKRIGNSSLFFENLRLKYKIDAWEIDVIKEMLNFEQKDRITANEILKKYLNM